MRIICILWSFLSLFLFLFCISLRISCNSIPVYALFHELHEYIPRDRKGKQWNPFFLIQQIIREKRTSPTFLSKPCLPLEWYRCSFSVFEDMLINNVVIILLVRAFAFWVPLLAATGLLFLLVWAADVKLLHQEADQEVAAIAEMFFGLVPNEYEERPPYPMQIEDHGWEWSPLTLLI